MLQSTEHDQKSNLKFPISEHIHKNKDHNNFTFEDYVPRLRFLNFVPSVVVQEANTCATSTMPRYYYHSHNGRNAVTV
ncbi:MAG: hypothetical protein N3E37_03895 [Candidatus Micrarchaeota archaeon]|nr:hypothetical protein [Candidatus Micrarchaeota archaeon]